jgi:prepilin-type N-terminal cleavage/methylation domain-containing protein
MSKKFSGGFTLIELLVVIAIIGVLSSIVLASVNSARDKAANAAVKSNLKNTHNQMELFNDTNSTYVDACLDPQVVVGLEGASMQGTGATTNYECQSDPLLWAMQAPLKVPDNDGSTYWCLDSAGASKGETVLLGASLSCV